MLRASICAREAAFKAPRPASWAAANATCVRRIFRPVQLGNKDTPSRIGLEDKVQLSGSTLAPTRSVGTTAGDLRRHRRQCKPPSRRVFSCACGPACAQPDTTHRPAGVVGFGCAQAGVVSARVSTSTRLRCGWRQQHGDGGCKLGCGETGKGLVVRHRFKTRSLLTVSLHPDTRMQRLQ